MSWIWRISTIPAACLGFILAFASPDLSFAEIVPHAVEAGDVTFRAPNGDSQILLPLLNGALLPEGTAWDTSESVRLRNKDEEIEIALGAPITIGAMALQGDNNDSYFVEIQESSGTWRPLWVAPKVSIGNGLRTRVIQVLFTAARIRIRPGTGDGNFSVSRLLLFPEPFAGEIEKYRFESRTTQLFNLTSIAKKTVAIAALLAAMLALYSGSAALRRHGFAVVGFLGLAAIPLWWNLGTAHSGVYLHHWDFGHYYLGAKYFDELGYSRLYRCALQADLEAGVVSLHDRPIIRDLTSNQLREATALPLPPSECHSHFTDARWKEFAGDVAWLRERLPPQRWELFKRDHGFNGSPVWTVVGGAIANSVPLNEANALYLQGIDWLLLMVMWIVLTWGFGWRGAAFAAIYWGTNILAPYLWTGSSFLRHDWLVSLAASAAFLRRGFPIAGGALLAYSALLRVFPVLVLLPWILVKIRAAVTERKLSLSTEERRCLVGGLATVLLLCGVAAARSPQGIQIFTDFRSNMEKHRTTPLTNCVGIPFLLSFSVDSRAYQVEDPRGEDPFMRWKEMQQSTFASRRLLYMLILALYAAPFLLRRNSLDLWEQLCIGVTAIPLFTSLTFYYYGFLLLLGLLWERARSAAVGIIAFSLFTLEIENWFPAYDEQGALVSLAVLLLIFTVIFVVTGRSQRGEPGLKES